MLFTAILGTLVGFISSFFGVGGGIVIVPGLTFVMPELPQTVIIGCSLAIICLNGIMNSFYFYRAGQRPELKLILLLGGAMIVGSLTGTTLSMQLDPRLLKRLFAAVLFAVFLKTILKKQPVEQDHFTGIRLNLKSTFLVCLLGFAGGVLAGLTGVGGGIIVVPMLTSFFAVPIGRVSSYSNPVMAMATFAASLSYLSTPVVSLVPLPYPQWQVGHINFLIVGVIVLASLLIAPLGVKLTKTISPKKAKGAFAALLLIMAIKMTNS